MHTVRQTKTLVHRTLVPFEELDSVGCRLIGEADEIPGQTHGLWAPGGIAKCINPIISRLPWLGIDIMLWYGGDSKKTSFLSWSRNPDEAPEYSREGGSRSNMW